MSWFEWSLYARRHRLNIQRFEAIEEGHWARFRIQWAEFRNANAGKNAMAVEPQDLIKLSFDKKEEVEPEKKLSFKEAKAQFGSRIKRDGSK